MRATSLQVMRQLKFVAEPRVTSAKAIDQTSLRDVLTAQRRPSRVDFPAINGGATIGCRSATQDASGYLFLPPPTPRAT